MNKQFYVYILASHRKTLYIGVTNDMSRRMFLHRTGTGSAFTRQYNVKRLVYLEMVGNSYAAISREKQLKGWRREKKLRLIEHSNPQWRDLSLDF